MSSAPCLSFSSFSSLCNFMSDIEQLENISEREREKEREADSTTWSTRCWKITQLQYIHAFLFPKEEEKNIWLEYLMLFPTACCIPCKAFLVQWKRRHCLQDNENQRLYWVKFPFRFTLFVSERVKGYVQYISFGIKLTYKLIQRQTAMPRSLEDVFLRENTQELLLNRKRNFLFRIQEMTLFPAILYWVWKLIKYYQWLSFVIHLCSRISSPLMSLWGKRT